MKQWMCALLVCLLCAVCGAALGEIGFAEIAMDRVNFREKPGGRMIDRFDAPQSVFVYEEKTVDGRLWCHVTTYRGKDNVHGWIRADMLRFLSEEFTDVVQVNAGSHYVMGLRADGTVAIMGNDMPHAPCVDTVRGWRDMTQVSSWICEAFGLDSGGEVHAVGRHRHWDGMRAAKMGGHMPMLLDADGHWIEDTRAGDMPEALKGLPFAELIGQELTPYAGLTEQGEVVCAQASAALDQAFSHGPYTQMDFYWNHIVALRADGRVDAFSLSDHYSDRRAEAVKTDGWTDVTAVAAGENHTLGLRRDGTVYYAGDDGEHAWQVAKWTDVVQLDAGKDYSIALRRDGSVVMAGEYEHYFR